MAFSARALLGVVTAIALTAMQTSVAQTTAEVPTPTASPAPAAAAPTARAHRFVAPAPAQPVAPPVVPAGQVGARLTPGAPIPPAELEAFVDGVVRTSMATEHIAGVTVAVVQNGQVMLKKGYGFAGRSGAKPVDPDRTLFRLGSISKTFTWIAVMKEVEAGHIRLEQPVNLYLPEKLQVRDQGFHTPVRMADLMTHSAGFEDRALGQLFEKDVARVRPLETYLRQERPNRVREPRTLPAYSNYGAALAGAAAAYTAGKPYETLVEGEIIQPLGLTHTTFREPYPAKAGLPAPMPAAWKADVSEGFRWTGSGYEARPYEYISQIAPAGAVSSTAADMARYMLMMLGNGTVDGVTIYTPETAQAFRTASWRPAPGATAFDHGFMEFALPGGYAGYGHGGATLSFFSELATVPDLNLGVFISTNTETGRPLAERLPRAIVGRFYAPASEAPPAGAPALKEERSIYAGTYLTTRRAYHGLEKFVDLLQAAAHVSVSDDGRLVVTGMGEPSVWVPTSTKGQFRRVDGPERLVFSFDQDGGKAIRFYGTSGTQAFERKSVLWRTSLLALLAIATGAVAVSAIVGVFQRRRGVARATTVQNRAGLMQTSASALWLAAMILFGVWVTRSGDVVQIFYGWPDMLTILASACALVAAALTLGMLVLSPIVWRGGRRVDSWTTARKLRFSATVLVFSLFSILLALWGALEPWGG